MDILMKKQLPALLILIMTCALIISACDSPDQDTLPPARARGTVTTAPPAPTATSTPEFDPCAPENIPVEVEKVHKIMREFNDAALLASNTPLEQLNPSIADLQRVRREAEDLPVPYCLTTLKQYQLAHMSTVINTLMGFLSGEEADVLNQGIVTARQQHDQYTQELATLLGLTMVAAPTPALVQGTPQQETPQADVTPAPAPLVITNPGPTTVNLRADPDLNAENLGILAVNASAVVLGRTVDLLWYQIEFPNQPGQTAWVYASLVQLSEPTAELPIIEPAP
jgi:hypothetical protein